ncbi:suppressor of cytokine signaling 3-like [Microcaecilia unicolor]|uniref:Suppressor of cytokine signaling 3-like n=1 Tax=Microcaecilia unicolor TaxID=1415580 RepID=A0A6P7XTI2_9AMPH|nr:suppressor of cytokine signaling 3-like [Microcaecilia unicolor]XP_030053759.1 suppressor of cytokine signaling 3-like [Microcaecilia unicolor]
MLALHWCSSCRCLFPSPGFMAMTSPAAAKLSYHYKSFCGNFERVETALERLEASGFYWSTLSGAEAKKLLADQALGVFLIRDSSDHHHLFTLSVRTAAGITNLRIKQEGPSFFLETVPGAEQPPTFNCVVKLVDHYVRLTSAGESDSNLCYVEGKERPVPLVLTRPLNCKVVSLQHLCRRTVAANVARGVASPSAAELEDMPVPGVLRSVFKN